MTNTDEGITFKWRLALAEKLREEKGNDIIIPYSQVSLAFSGGPHSASFDVQRIDWNTFKPWAENLGWRVQPSPETTDPKLPDTMPDIRFKRIFQD